MSETKQKDKQGLLEITNLRLKVTEYISQKLKDKKIAPLLEEALYQNSFARTSLNEVKLFKYQIFKQRYNYGLSFIVINISIFEEKIKNKEIIPSDIFNQEPVKLFPEKWAESNKRKEEEDKFLYDRQLVSNSTTAKCFKCQVNNVFVSMKQTRSADEPETIFYQCLTTGCYNKWKT
jgi:DNA-directed RNA polymerase subunit M/transcription elongation factor TFIIS